MELKPVEAIRCPKYPLRQEMRADAQFLLERIPRGWRHFGKTVALLAAAGISGCGNVETGVTTTSPTSQPNDIVIEAGYWTRSLMQEQVFFIACVIMSPPAYTAEDAAVDTGTNEPFNLKEAIKAFKTNEDSE